jgi:hypothetical protein
MEFPNFDKLLRRFGFDVNDLELIGYGDHGLAFASNDKVIKITDDKNEARAAANLINKKLTGTNQIYYVGSFSKLIQYHDPEITDDKIQYYVIIQELVDTVLSADERKAIDLVSNWLDELERWPFDVDEACRKIGENGAVRSLLNSINELYKHGVKYMDIHSGNVGHNKDGKLVVFDLGVSEAKSVAYGRI